MCLAREGLVQTGLPRKNPRRSASIVTHTHNMYAFVIFAIGWFVNSPLKTTSAFLHCNLKIPHSEQPTTKCRHRTTAPVLLLLGLLLLWAQLR